MYTNTFFSLALLFLQKSCKPYKYCITAELVTEFRLCCGGHSKVILDKNYWTWSSLLHQTQRHVIPPPRLASHGNNCCRARYCPYLVVGKGYRVIWFHRYWRCHLAISIIFLQSQIENENETERGNQSLGHKYEHVNGICVTSANILFLLFLKSSQEK